MYSLDAYIICNNSGVRNALKAILPNESDPRIGGDFEFSEFTDDNGNEVITVMIRFKPENKADRDSLFASLKSLNGLFNQCESDSWVGYHTCGNYENPPISCRAMELYREFWNGSGISTEHTIDGVLQ